MEQDKLERLAKGVEEVARAEALGVLSAAELEMVRAAATGEVAYYGPSKRDDDPSNDPSNGQGWGKEREVRAAVIRWLCVERHAKDRVDPRGIRIHSAKVTGELNLSNVTVPFPLSLRSCKLTHDAVLYSIEIPRLDFGGTHVQSLKADDAVVKAELVLSDGFCSHGEVRLPGAQIGGDLECNRGTFTNPPRQSIPESGQALNADGVRVRGDVLLTEGFQATGKVSLVGAQINGNLECNSGVFKNPRLKDVPGSGTALDADNITVTGNVYLMNNFRAEGQVAISHAQIGALTCSGGEFINPASESSEWALDAQLTTVRGAVTLGADFSVEGSVGFPGAHIEGILDCRGTKFKGASLSLSDTRAGSIMDDAESWPDRGNLYLDGFVYDRISDGPRDAKTRLKWLALQDDFTPQPYLQLAKILKAAGDDDGAISVLVEMEHRRGNQALIDPVWRPLFEFTVGYGYRPLRAIWEVMGLSALGWILYRRSYLAGNIVPSDKDAYYSFKIEDQPPAHYAAFSPLVYSVENSLPLVKLGQSDKWQPDPNPETAAMRGRSFQMGRGRPHIWSQFLWLPRFLVLCGLTTDMNPQAEPSRLSRWGTSARFLRWFLWIQILLGWLLATLFLAGVTGIVRTQ